MSRPAGPERGADRGRGEIVGCSILEAWTGEVGDGVDGEVDVVGGGGGCVVVFAGTVSFDLEGGGAGTYATRFSHSYCPVAVNWRSRSV